MMRLDDMRIECTNLPHTPSSLFGDGEEQLHTDGEVGRGQRRTRVLRDALQQVLRKLQYGQIVLATVGAIAPFVGLLGTVWGIYQALIGMASAGQITIERIAGPVGEALVMTAAGLAVAIPAVLAYNVFGHRIGRLEADLEGFALDLRDLLLTAPEERP
jgi:biopolymer transport protein ExbB